MVTYTWNFKVPKKFKVFCGPFILQKCENSEITEKNFHVGLVPQACGLCNSSEELMDHIFLHCPSTFKVWLFVRSELGFSFCVPQKIDDLFLDNFSGGMCFGIMRSGPCFGSFGEKGTVSFFKIKTKISLGGRGVEGEEKGKNAAGVGIAAEIAMIN